ncbi:MAG: hypothetical protein PWQ12_1776 [Clostridiales bacterium]|jgi:hypothetical protein|nr:hypothetical protein [Clostridiales bacterium]
MRKYAREFLLSWKVWFIVLTLFLFGLFTYCEIAITLQQPSENWSLAYEITTGLPKDERLIDEVESISKDGVVVAYYSNGKVTISSYDWEGQLLKSEVFACSLNDVKVLEITGTDKGYRVYVSDRKQLDRYELNPETFEVIGDSTVSEHAEQFSAAGEWLLSGDDALLQLFEGEDLIWETSDYENLKRVNLTFDVHGAAGTYDTENGGNLIVTANKTAEWYPFSDENTQKQLGYAKDLYLTDSEVTVLSSQFNPIKGGPLRMGEWIVDRKTGAIKTHQVLYHGSTDLEPQIVLASEGTLRYVLGLSQSYGDEPDADEETQSFENGLFTNVSLFERIGGRLTENTRLTATMKYPSEYAYFEHDGTANLLWVDLIQGEGTLYMAGTGEAWIQFALKHYPINGFRMMLASVFSFVSMLYYGFLFFIIDLSEQWKVILAFLMLMFLYQKFAPGEIASKKRYGLYATMLFVSGIKFYLSVWNGNFGAVASVYPFLLGNAFVLTLISLGTSVMALWILWRWHHAHLYYKSESILIGLWIALELYTYFYGILVYYVTALSRVNFTL